MHEAHSARVSTHDGDDAGGGATAAAGPVGAYNEWDPLEEVIVGVIDGATVPPWHDSFRATIPEGQWGFFRAQQGRPFPPERVAAARRELDELVRILTAEGVTVRRPDVASHARPFATPGWQSACGLYAAMPRDVLLVIGDEIIEAPTAWRARYFETWPYRALLKDYFRRGARWSAAPKPELADELFDPGFVDPKPGEPMRYVITEHEPTFDAADFVRCGRDIFCQKSNVTNDFGIAWLRRHLGDRYRIHVFEFEDTHPMHIDATLMPIGPGKLLINPERVPKLPAIFRGWDVFEAPAPCIPEEHTLYLTSRWINMNVLMLDERRVVVEKSDAPMIAAFERWGFEPIPCPFRNFNSFGGSFHCATVDVRRRGSYASYF
ncbi:MAG TPA: inosamine-phosphate amidinotransferase 1 [Polyangiaceae bacterium]|nr:inosamine-phosphate amidinotransferase 1 [Polyangiaceae bacterium]